MENKNVILVVIAILIIILVAVSAYIYVSDSGNNNANATNNNTTKVIDVDKANNNTTLVGDNSTRNDTNKSNATYKVYNPQSDSYVTVIGEKYDDEVNRWYTYDSDGVRYYNTRIK